MSVVPDNELISAAAALLEACRARGLTLSTAESCTGGLIAAALTEVAGSSEVFDRGFVTYSNAAKTELLGVLPKLVAEQGAVSAAVSEAMAQGAIAASGADLAVAVTGVAGPGGGTAAKPLGLVHLAAARRGGTTLHREMRYGDIGRAAIRRQSAADALSLVQELLEKPREDG